MHGYRPTVPPPHPNRGLAYRRGAFPACWHPSKRPWRDARQGDSGQASAQHEPLKHRYMDHSQTGIRAQNHSPPKENETGELPPRPAGQKIRYGGDAARNRTWASHLPDECSTDWAMEAEEPGMKSIPLSSVTIEATLQSPSLYNVYIIQREQI